jgi:hydrogenase maturation protease
MTEAGEWGSRLPHSPSRRSSIHRLDIMRDSHCFPRTRIIGLGNTLLSDDGVGIVAVREVARRIAGIAQPADIDIVESEVGGFVLMELMAGWERIILVDSIQFDGVEAGTVLRMDPNDLRTSLRIRSVHDIDLPTALELGRRLGLQMPTQIVIFGIQAEDAWTLGESMSAPVEQGMKAAVDLILKELEPEALPKSR